MYRRILVVLTLAIMGYLAFHLIATRSNKHHWDTLCLNGLANLHRSWMRDGQPEQYDVARYYQSSSGIVDFYSDTNRYLVDGKSMKGLFVSGYAWKGESIIFLVMDDGSLFRRQGEQQLRRVDWK